MHAMLADEIQVHHRDTNFSTDFDPISLIIVWEIYGQVARKSYSPMPDAKVKLPDFLSPVETSKWHILRIRWRYNAFRVVTRIYFYSDHHFHGVFGNKHCSAKKWGFFCDSRALTWSSLKYAVFFRSPILAVEDFMTHPPLPPKWLKFVVNKADSNGISFNNS